MISLIIIIYPDGTEEKEVSDMKKFAVMVVVITVITALASVSVFASRYAFS